MKRRLMLTALVMLASAFARTASAQLLAAKDGPIVYGHHHVAASDIEAHKKFWGDALGGTPMKFGGTGDIVKFPNVLIFLRAQKPTGGTIGTTANHIAFTVTNLRAVVDKIKANGFKMITQSELTAPLKVVDDIATFDETNSVAFALGPDDVKVELFENRQQPMPVTLHHVHFFSQQNVEMRAWYAKVFGAKPREAPNFPAADLPGVALHFSASPTAVASTQGRAVDHVGFEVENLEAFCKKLEAMGIPLAAPLRTNANLGLSYAFIFDPWGTYIELTEGLDKVS